jgi:DNA-binding transcriptional regulator YiaG
LTEPYHYLESGLPNVWLHGVVVHETPYGRGTSIPAVEGLHRAIGLAIAESNRRMTGAEVRFLRSELDLSQRMLAGLLGVQENTLRRWELGETRIPGPAQRALAGYYVETIRKAGCMRDLMPRLAATDRDFAEPELRFERRGDGWAQKAA